MYTICSLQFLITAFFFWALSEALKSRNQAFLTDFGIIYAMNGPARERFNEIILVILNSVLLEGMGSRYGSQSTFMSAFVCDYQEYITISSWPFSRTEKGKIIKNLWTQSEKYFRDSLNEIVYTRVGLSGWRGSQVFVGDKLKYRNQSVCEKKSCSWNSVQFSLLQESYIMDSI